jgi:hypothetical protein
MYLPGLCACLLVAAAIDSLVTYGRATRIGGLVAATTVLTCAVISVRVQASAWSRASSVAHDAVEQFRPFAAGASDVFIPNLPFWFAGGPYVLKDYAFGYYFANAPKVRARSMAVEMAGEHIRFSGWVGGSTGAVATTDLPAPAAGERILVLRNGVMGVPLLAAVRPSQVSVFATSDARHVSDVTLELTSLEPWRAESSDPSVFRVEPERGTVSGRLRIVPLPRDTPIDRIETVTIRADDAAGAELATLTLRIRMAATFASSSPPFGAVDLPAAPTVARDSSAVILQGWALDDFCLRRVFGEAIDAAGTRVDLGDATRDGERPDVSRLFPVSHDLYRANWRLSVDAATIASLRAPITMTIYAEDSDGLQTRLGARTIR